MTNAVYILGSGFSAPLGLPVIRNFLAKSKDQFTTDPSKFEHFKRIFEEIDRLGKIKNFYHANLFDVEELLSTLEMRLRVESADDPMKDFIEYIRAVIVYHTPAPTLPKHVPGNWSSFLFCREELQRSYAYFVAGLLHVTVDTTAPALLGDPASRFQGRVARDSAPRYSVVTLNYDTLLEGFAAGIAGFCRLDPLRVSCEADSDLALAKLHGCVSKGTVIAPTWSKILYPEIRDAWVSAHEALSEANYIRIVGYSLPPGDAYMRFLLKSAALKSFNLKRVDILCLDPEGDVRSRYREFLAFPETWFLSESVENYLRAHHRLYQHSGERFNLSIDRLEEAHRSFFSSAVRL